MSSSTLDAEIQRLKKQADKLRAEAKLHATALLSRPDAAQHVLAAQPARPATAAAAAAAADGPLSAAQADQLRERRARQAAHDGRNAYRACAGVTAFRARDPDPAAVDGGSILGLRFEAMRSAGRFLRPFYVLLNRPWAASSSTSSAAAAAAQGHDASSLRRYLRVHRHTLPPAIPLAGLAARYLPPPPRTRSGGSAEAGKERRQQDLGAFVRHLRREIVRYHHRLGAVADMRAAAGVDRDPARKSSSKPSDNDGDDDDDGSSRDSAATDQADGIVDIQPADTAAMQIRIEWRDGRVGRLVLGPNGEVRRCAVVGAEGSRDRLAELDVAGGCERVEDVVAKLQKGG